MSTDLNTEACTAEVGGWMWMCGVLVVVCECVCVCACACVGRW